MFSASSSDNNSLGVCRYRSGTDSSPVATPPREALMTFECDKPAAWTGEPAWNKPRSCRIAAAALVQDDVKNYWLVKQEPSAYSWDDFAAEGRTSWTGVRNYTARNNLRAMSEGDEVLYYHSVTDKAVIGLARVARSAYRDPTATDGDWSAVDLIAVRKFPRPVTLEQIKNKRRLKEMALLRLSRLSVQPVSAEEYREIVALSG